MNNTRLCFGDHYLLIFTLKTKCVSINEELKRNWRSYSKALLCNKLSLVDFDVSINNVQECWNDFENKLMAVVDEITPLRIHCHHVIKSSH